MTIGTCALETLFITNAGDFAADATVVGLPSITVKQPSIETCALATVIFQENALRCMHGETQQNLQFILHCSRL